MLAMQEGNAALLTGRKSSEDARAAVILQAAEDAALLEGGTPLSLPALETDVQSDLDLL